MVVGGLGGSAGFEKNKANAPVWLSQKPHVTVSTQHAQYATQLLFSVLVSLFVLPLVFTVVVVMEGIGCLLENFTVGLTRVS